MSILCTICARSGSKGILNKALKKIYRKPLISYTIRQAVKSKVFDEIVVSTDSQRIQKIARAYGAKSWFLRPKNLSKDNTPKLPVIRHALIMSEKFFKKKFTICFDLDLTSPLRTINDIKNSIKKFKRTNCDNLFSVNYAKKNPYFNMVEEKNDSFSLVKKINKNFYSRQKSPKVFEMNSSIYIYKRKFLMDKKKLYTKRTSIFLMPRNRSIDIDDALDLTLVKKIIKYDKRLFK